MLAEIKLVLPRSIDRHQERNYRKSDTEPALAAIINSLARPAAIVTTFVTEPPSPLWIVSRTFAATRQKADRLSEYHTDNKLFVSPAPRFLLVAARAWCVRTDR
jgi:hypothetical protein